MDRQDSEQELAQNLDRHLSADRHKSAASVATDERNRSAGAQSTHRRQNVHVSRRTATTPAGKLLRWDTVTPSAAVDSDSVLKPRWQVDRFRWPSLTDQLIAQPGNRIGQFSLHAIEQLGAKKRLGVSGFGRRSGKTAVAICIARWLSRRRRVLLIDADVDTAHLTGFTGIGRSLCWLETMLRGRAPREALIQSATEQLTVAPLNRPESKRLADRAMDYLDQLCHQVQPGFDYIVADLGDACFLNRRTTSARPVVDGCFILHNQRQQVTADQLELAILRMRNKSIKPLAVIQNFSSDNKP